MNKILMLFNLLIISLNLSAVENKMEYWKTQKKGANGSFSKFSEEWFREAKEANLDYIRLNTRELQTNDKHFLIGSSKDFTKLNEIDLKYLIKILDTADKYDLKIVLTMFELPGRIYFDDNGDEKDNRLWKDKKYWKQSFDLWLQLATQLKDHPAIVAYNPLNEPTPELIYGHEEANTKFKKWLKKSKGSASDLNLFNKQMIEAIRTIDKDIPIMLDGYFYCDPKGLPYMDAYNDPNILYAFHNPAPWEFATYRINKGRYSYPDKMPKYWNGPAIKWDIKRLQKTLKPVYRFIKKNRIPNYQMVASEVWCDRRVEGCAEYFRDILSLYNSNKWHWAFYAFRNDTAWTGLDYELGSERIEGNYWYKVDELNIDPESLKERNKFNKQTSK